MESGFWFAFAVEEERMVYARPGEGVEPALSVVQVPEGYARDDVGIFTKQTKELRVLVGLSLQDFRRATLAIGIELCQFGTVFSAIRPPPAARHDVNVQLRHDDLHTEFAHGREGGFDVRQRNAIDFIVAL